MKKVLITADKILAKILRITVISLCVAIGVLLFMRVIVRFSPIVLQMAWSDEIVELMMAWMIFTGAALIMRDSDHFKVDLIQEKFAGKKWVDLLDVFIILIGIAFFAVFFYFSLDLVKRGIHVSPMLHIPWKYAYLSMPVNCALMLIYQIRDLIKTLIHLFRKRDKAEQSVVNS